MVSTRTLPFAFIDLLAAFFDDPGHFVGFFVGQTAGSSPRSSLALQPTAGVQTVNIVGSLLQPLRWQRLQLLDDGFQFAHDYFKRTL